MHPLTLLPPGDTDIAVICAVCLLVVVCLLSFSRLRLQRSRARVGVRVLVAGTRGKSTTTRLIRTGLSAAGLRTVGRVSGTVPKYLATDGTESVWPRFGRPAIGEIESVVHRAARQGADAIAVENMAINSRLSHAVIAGILRPHVVVITNLRPDHLEEQAEQLETEYGRMAALLPPKGSVLVSTTSTATVELRELASRKGVTLGVAPPAESQIQELKELAITACAALVPARAEAARHAIMAEPVDGASFRPFPLSVADRSFSFLDAFACNDTESLGMLLDEAGVDDADVVVLNARADRPLRTGQFLGFLKERSPSAHIFLVGAHLPRRLIARYGLSIEPLSARGAGAVLAAVAASVPQDGMAWGVGNEHGLGAGLSRAVRASAC